MAEISKFTSADAIKIFKHVHRQLGFYKNPDVDTNKINTDYYISPAREVDGYSRYKAILGTCYLYGRKNLKTLAGIIVTLPRDVEAGGNREHDFFHAAYNFLNERYCGEDHCCSAIVHCDESGQPHMHYLFVPTVKLAEEKHGKKWKVCASDVLSRDSYYTLHQDMQSYLDTHLDFHATVSSGVTRAQGGNRTVRELKSETAREREEREKRAERALRTQTNRWERAEREREERGRW